MRISILLILLILSFSIGAQETTVEPVTIYSESVHTTLSPDGTMLAWTDASDGLCVYRFADDSTTCTPFPNRALRDHTALRWSPDSSLIALTENWLVAFAESDLWLYEVESATLTNRTDDDAAGSAVSLRQDGQAFALDTTPVWNPANGDLYFVRYTPTDGLRGYTAALYRIPRLGGDVLGVLNTENAGLADGEPVQVVALDDPVLSRLSIYHGGEFALNGGAAINAEGARLVLLARPATFDDISVWEVDLDAETYAQIAGVESFGERLRGVAFDEDDSVLVAAGQDISALYRDGEPINGFAVVSTVTFSGGVLALSTDGSLALLGGDEWEVIARVPEEPGTVLPLVRPSAGFDGDTLRVLMLGYLFTLTID